MGLLPQNTFSLAIATDLLLHSSAASQIRVAELKAICQIFPAPTDLQAEQRINWSIQEYRQADLSPEQQLEMDILTARYMAESYAEGEVAFYQTLYRIFERTYVFGEGLEDHEKDARFKEALSQALPDRLYQKFLAPNGWGRPPYYGMIGFFKAATLGFISVEEAVAAICDGTKGDQVQYRWTSTGMTLSKITNSLITNTADDQESLGILVDSAKEAVEKVIEVYKEAPIRKGIDGFEKQYEDIVEVYTGITKRKQVPKTCCLARVEEASIGRSPFVLKDAKGNIIRDEDGNPTIVTKYKHYQIWVPIDENGNEVGVAYLEQLLDQIKKLAERTQKNE